VGEHAKALHVLSFSCPPREAHLLTSHFISQHEEKRGSPVIHTFYYVSSQISKEKEREEEMRK
jgi:hypothetical protein